MRGAQVPEGNAPQVPRCSRAQRVTKKGEEKAKPLLPSHFFLSYHKAGEEADETAKDAPPYDEPAQVFADHVLNDGFDHVRGEFV